MFCLTDFVSALAAAKEQRPTLIVLNLYGWRGGEGECHAGIVESKIGTGGGPRRGRSVWRPLGYANNAGAGALSGIQRSTLRGSKRFIQAVVENE